MSISFRNIIFVLAALLLASCNHKDLCYEHPHGTRIRLVYDWTDAPEADPKGMCVFFYSLDDADKSYRFDFDNTNGGEIELPAGRYMLITYNNDTEIVRFSATNSFYEHRAYTRTGDLLEPLYGNGITSSTKTDNGQRIMITPDALWGCHLTEVIINEHGVTYTYSKSGTAPPAGSTDSQTITLYPHDMLCHYSYEVRNVDNAEHINLVSASLSGMAGSMSLSNESLDSEPVTLPLSASVDASTRKITGEFLTFGHSDTNGAKHKMEFYIVMDDGTKYRIKDTSNLDVTSQVDNAPDQRRVHIIIDNLKIPHSTDTDAGFNPSVDDWGIQEEELKI